MKFSFRAAITVLAISLLALALLATACSSPFTSPSLTSTGVKSKAFIWKISSETTSVYLLGSVHVASPDIYPLDSTIEDAFDSADYLAVELNIKDVNLAAVVLLEIKYGRYPQGEGLADNIDEVLYGRFVFKARNAFDDVIAYTEVYRPWTLFFGDAGVLYDNVGYEASSGIDLHFIEKATKKGKEIIELETVKYEISQMAAIPDDVVVRAIIYGIDNPVDPETELEALFRAWVDGDSAEIERIAFQSLYDEPELAPFYEKMYSERNLQMLEKIMGFLAGDESYFVCVGAGHLVGEGGLVNLLTEKGYTVEQLNNSD